MVSPFLCARSKRAAVRARLSAQGKEIDAATVWIAPLTPYHYGEGTAAAVKKELKAPDGAHISSFIALRDLQEPCRSCAQWPTTCVGDEEFVMLTPLGQLEASG